MVLCTATVNGTKYVTVNGKKYPAKNSISVNNSSELFTTTPDGLSFEFFCDIIIATIFQYKIKPTPFV